MPSPEVHTLRGCLCVLSPALHAPCPQPLLTAPLPPTCRGPSRGRAATTSAGEPRPERVWVFQTQGRCHSRANGPWGPRSPNLGTEETKLVPEPESIHRVTMSRTLLASHRLLGHADRHRGRQGWDQGQGQGERQDQARAGVSGLRLRSKPGQGWDQGQGQGQGLG